MKVGQVKDAVASKGALVVGAQVLAFTGLVFYQLS